MKPLGRILCEVRYGQGVAVMEWKGGTKVDLLRRRLC